MATKSLSFNLRILLVFGAATAIYGTVQLIGGWYYGDIAKREATAIGVIHHVDNGPRHTLYSYSFQLGSQTIHAMDEVCETALATGPCDVGTPVLVYYDRSDPGSSQLKEYGAESRREFGLARWMIPVGLTLLLLFYLLLRAGQNADSDDKLDDEPDEQDSDILHIVPEDRASK